MLLNMACASSGDAVLPQAKRRSWNSSMPRTALVEESLLFFFCNQIPHEVLKGGRRTLQVPGDPTGTLLPPSSFVRHTTNASNELLQVGQN